MQIPVRRTRGRREVFGKIGQKNSAGSAAFMRTGLSALTFAPHALRINANYLPIKSYIEHTQFSLLLVAVRCYLSRPHRN
jgi:hypothetical protein